MQDFKKTISNIKSIKIQGATNVARASVLAWRDYLSSLTTANAADFLIVARKIGVLIASARPNEPMTINALQYLMAKLNEAARAEKTKISTNDLKKLARQQVSDFVAMVENNNKLMAGHGARLIKNKDKIFTHCHSKTVVNIFEKAKREGKKIHIFNDETRPLLQGRLTAEDLARAGIANTMVVDATASFLVSDFSGDEVKINKVIMGCDAILKDNSALNKAGSFSIALSAYTSGIPVYLAGTIFKKTSLKMKATLRDQNEVWPSAPKGLKIINYDFDRVPARMITGYITEFGVIKPGEIDKYAKKYYPWILKNQN